MSTAMLDTPTPPPTPPGADAADDTEPSEADHLSPLARRLGSPEAMVWFKRVVLAGALAFLVASVGYLVGVKTTVPPSSAVDVGFLQDMSDHHDQAVQIATAELAHGRDPQAKEFAREVLLFQRWELGVMHAYLEERGAVPTDFDPQRTTMAWMGMPTPLDRMPGMASEQQLEQLNAAQGTESDKQFLRLMMDHHLGGAHMGDYAAQNAADPKIRELAERMAKNQRVEVNEYQLLLDKLNAQG
jgi:uncharacterized protein (DUF305 family)